MKTQTMSSSEDEHDGDDESRMERVKEESMSSRICELKNSGYMKKKIISAIKKSLKTNNNRIHHTLTLNDVSVSEEKEIGNGCRQSLNIRIDLNDKLFYSSRDAGAMSIDTFKLNDPTPVSKCSHCSEKENSMKDQNTSRSYFVCVKCGKKEERRWFHENCKDKCCKSTSIYCDNCLKYKLTSIDHNFEVLKDAKFSKYMYVVTCPSGDGVSLHMDYEKIVNLTQEEQRYVAKEFLKEAFKEDKRGFAQFTVAIVHNGSSYMPDLLKLLAELHPTLPVKTTKLKCNIETENMDLGTYYTKVKETYNNGTFAFGPLNETQAASVKNDECGAYLPELLSLLEKSPFLSQVLPWSDDMTTRRFKTPHESDDGPIFWCRPGEQIVSLDKNSKRNRWNADEIESFLKERQQNLKFFCEKRYIVEELKKYRRSYSSREFLFEDRTKPHADQVWGNHFEPTAAVGVIQAIHPDEIPEHNRACKEIVVFHAKHFEMLEALLHIDVTAAPKQQCAEWLDDAKLNMIRQMKIRYSKLHLYDNDIYFIPRKIVHQFKTISATLSVAWHTRLVEYYLEQDLPIKEDVDAEEKLSHKSDDESSRSASPLEKKPVKRKRKVSYSTDNDATPKKKKPRSRSSTPQSHVTPAKKKIKPRSRSSTPQKREKPTPKKARPLKTPKKNLNVVVEESKERSPLPVPETSASLDRSRSPSPLKRQKTKKNSRSESAEISVSFDRSRSPSPVKRQKSKKNSRSKSSEVSESIDRSWSPSPAKQNEANSRSKSPPKGDADMEPEASRERTPSPVAKASASHDQSRCASPVKRDKGKKKRSRSRSKSPRKREAGNDVSDSTSVEKKKKRKSRSRSRKGEESRSHSIAGADASAKKSTKKKKKDRSRSKSPPKKQDKVKESPVESSKGVEMRALSHSTKTKHNGSHSSEKHKHEKSSRSRSGSPKKSDRKKSSHRSSSPKKRDKSGQKSKSRSSSWKREEIVRAHPLRSPSSDGTNKLARVHPLRSPSPCVEDMSDERPMMLPPLSSPSPSVGSMSTEKPSSPNKNSNSESSQPECMEMTSSPSRLVESADSDEQSTSDVVPERSSPPSSPERAEQGLSEPSSPVADRVTADTVVITRRSPTPPPTLVKQEPRSPAAAESREVSVKSEPRSPACSQSDSRSKLIPSVVSAVKEEPRSPPKIVKEVEPPVKRYETVEKVAKRTTVDGLSEEYRKEKAWDSPLFSLADCDKFVMTTRPNTIKNGDKIVKQKTPNSLHQADESSKRSRSRSKSPLEIDNSKNQKPLQTQPAEKTRIDEKKKSEKRDKEKFHSHNSTSEKRDKEKKSLSEHRHKETRKGSHSSDKFKEKHHSADRAGEKKKLSSSTKDKLSSDGRDKAKNHHDKTKVKSTHSHESEKKRSKSPENHHKKKRKRDRSRSKNDEPKTDQVTESIAPATEKSADEEKSTLVSTEAENYASYQLMIPRVEIFDIGASLKSRNSVQVDRVDDAQTTNTTNDSSSELSEPPILISESENTDQQHSDE